MMHNDVTIISCVLAVTHEELSAGYGAIQIRVNRICKPCTLNNCRVSWGGRDMDEKMNLTWFVKSLTNYGVGTAWSE
jgi:hypothetical protein